MNRIPSDRIHTPTWTLRSHGTYARKETARILLNLACRDRWPRERLQNALWKEQVIDPLDMESALNEYDRRMGPCSS